jgi:hypothetical protein
LDDDRIVENDEFDLGVAGCAWRIIVWRLLW